MLWLVCSGKKSKEEAEKAEVEQEALNKITAALEAGRHGHVPPQVNHLSVSSIDVWLPARQCCRV